MVLTVMVSLEIGSALVVLGIAKLGQSGKRGDSSLREMKIIE